jgi:SAM-dependent methyltransferase
VNKQTAENSHGVLGGEYAEGRKIRPEMIFRLRTRARLAASAARRYLGNREGLRILDMGCAEGRTLAEMDRLLPGSRMLGIEYSPELIEAADGLAENIVLRRGDITHLPDDIEPGSFDMVTALAVLEHLVSPVAAVEQAARVLRPGGIFVATSPSPAWGRASAKAGLLEDDSHESDITKKAMARMVRDAGLEPVRYRRFMWAPIASIPYLRIPVSPGFALGVDRFIYSLKICNCLFVNQAIIARKAPIEH